MLRGVIFFCICFAPMGLIKWVVSVFRGFSPTAIFVSPLWGWNRFVVCVENRVSGDTMLAVGAVSASERNPRYASHHHIQAALAASQPFCFSVSSLRG